MLPYRSDGQEHGPQAHGHKLMLRQTHRIALSWRTGQRFSSDDINQTRFSLRCRRQITIGQVTATLTLEQASSEPAQATTAFGARRGQQTPVDRTGDHKRKIPVRLKETPLADTLRAESRVG